MWNARNYQTLSINIFDHYMTVSLPFHSAPADGKGGGLRNRRRRRQNKAQTRDSQREVSISVLSWSTSKGVLRHIPKSISGNSIGFESVNKFWVFVPVLKSCGFFNSFLAWKNKKTNHFRCTRCIFYFIRLWVNPIHFVTLYSWKTLYKNDDFSLIYITQALWTYFLCPFSYLSAMLLKLGEVQPKAYSL